MVRNNTAFWIHYSAYNASTNVLEAGDVDSGGVPNHTLKLFIDGVETVPTNSPEEIGAGEYRIQVTAAESNGAKFICAAGVSSTTSIYIIPAMVITDLLVPGTAFIACYTAWDGANNAPKTGDDANHTLTVAQNNTSAGATNTPTEVNAATCPGLYKLSVTAVEANGTAVSIVGTSSTADINIMPTELNPFQEVCTVVAQPLEIIEIETLEVIEL